MKKQKLMMTAIRVLFTMILAWVMSVPTLYAKPDDKPALARDATQGGILDKVEPLTQGEGQSNQLEGSWTAVVFPVVPPGVPQPSTGAYISFARGGVLIGFNRMLPFGSPQHGVWEHQVGHSYAFTFKQDLFDGTGSFIGTLTVRGRLTVDEKDEFIGNFSAERRDASGNQFPTGCGTIRGTRIKIEPAAEQCQNLNPPQ